MTNPANSTTTSRGRTYEWKGETFVSVTTVISGGVPKNFLKNWAKKLVAEAAVQEREVWAPKSEADAIDWLKHADDRVSDKASDIGSDVHEWAEAHVLGKPIPDPRPEIISYCGSFKKFLADWEPKYEATEATVYSRTHGYAGTLDALMWIDGRLYIVDYKTGKRIYPEVALQLAALRYADFIGLPDGSEAPIPDVFAGAALHIRPRGYKFHPIAAGPAQHRSFLYAKEVRQFTQEGDAFIGQAILPGEADPFSNLPTADEPAPTGPYGQPLQEVAR